MKNCSRRLNLETILVGHRLFVFRRGGLTFAY